MTPQKSARDVVANFSQPLPNADLEAVANIIFAGAYGPGIKITIEQIREEVFYNPEAALKILEEARKQVTALTVSGLLADVAALRAENDRLRETLT